MYVSVLYTKMPQRFDKRPFLSPWLQWQHIYTVACVHRWPGLWPRFHVFAVSVLCGFFHMTSLSCGFPCTFTQVKFSLWLMYRTLVTPASFSLHLRSEKDLCKSLSAFIYPCILHSSGGWCWWDLYWLLGSSHAQSCQINFVNFLTGTTFLVSLCCLQSAEEHAARTCVG